MFKLLRLSAFNSVVRMDKNYSQFKQPNCKRLVGKVAIVTASTQGIGFAIAQRLGAEGAHVVISSRRAENVTKAVEQLKSNGCSVYGMQCHVSKEEDRKDLIDKAVQEFGGIDILVSNAASNPTMGGLLDCSEPVWNKIFDVGVKNALQLTQLVVPHMRKRNGGSIVYVASIAGYKGIPLLGAYNVSKTALIGLAHGMATEVASDNIRVNCIAPGIVRTNFSAPLIQAGEHMKAFIDGNIPMGRVAEPDEMGGTVAFLCSDDASYITGESIVVAGGMQSRL